MTKRTRTSSSAIIANKIDNTGTAFFIPVYQDTIFQNKDAILSNFENGTQIAKLDSESGKWIFVDPDVFGDKINAIYGSKRGATAFSEAMESLEAIMVDNLDNPDMGYRARKVAANVDVSKLVADYNSIKQTIAACLTMLSDMDVTGLDKAEQKAINEKVKLLQSVTE